MSADPGPQSRPILQSTLPPGAVPPLPRLPGTSPGTLEDWLIRDAAFAPQMALRDRLIEHRRNAVLAQVAGSLDAAGVLLERILSHLRARPGYVVAADDVTRPDGVRVPVRRDDPLMTAGRLAQEDFCLLDKANGADQHVLVAAVLCFPASWTLTEKIGRPLTGVHAPVAEYDTQLGRRVQRLLDGVRPDRPLVRHNLLRYADPSLHQPRSESDPRPSAGEDAPFLRSERQSLLRLPRTGAVVFSIHTTVVAAPSNPPDGLAENGTGDPKAAR